MYQANVRQPQRFLGMPQGGAQPPRRGNVESGSEQMEGVQAIADGYRRVPVGQLVNRSQLFEAASNVRSGPGCILEQDRQVAGAETLRGFGAPQGINTRQPAERSRSATTRSSVV